MQQINNMMSGVDRSVLVKVVAIGLLVYAVLNGCAGIAAGIGGAMFGAGGLGASIINEAAGSTTLTAEQSAQLAEAQAALEGASGLGGLLLVLSILYLISVPLFLVTAIGLFQRKAWSRNLAIVSLGLVVVTSLLTISGSILNVLWLIVAAFVLYLFITDEGIKMELSR